MIRDRVLEFSEIPTDLGDECPPDDALRPDKDVVFRVAKRFPVTFDDLAPHRLRYPVQSFDKICASYAVSVFKSQATAKKYMNRMSYLGDRVIRIVLDSSHGLLAYGFVGRQDHGSWWRSGVLPDDVSLVVGPQE